jgi:hypothetical protein
MEPGETVAGYRRYYLHGLPDTCCTCTGTGTTGTTLRVTAIVKLEPIPATTDTDYLVLQNKEALIEECQAVRFSEMDSQEAQQLAVIHHLNAVRYLNGELTHYFGNDKPAVMFAPFGTARLERLNIAMK